MTKRPPTIRPAKEVLRAYFQAIAKPPKSLAALQRQASKSGAAKLTREEIGAEIAAVRHVSAAKRPARATSSPATSGTSPSRTSLAPPS